MQIREYLHVDAMPIIWLQTLLCRSEMLICGFHRPGSNHLLTVSMP